MDNVNKTLYIPLYGKSYVSRRGIILCDPKAEEIWKAEGFPLKGKAASHWLCLYMGMRAAVIDRWVKEKMETMPDAAVLHLGCGMDSRILRVGDESHSWYDVDFPEVITERKTYYRQTEHYHMIAADVRNPDFLEDMTASRAIVVMEGISMYLLPEELRQVLTQLCEQFAQVNLLMDCYSKFSAKASKYKNPINEVGVTEVFGLDDPKELEHSGLSFLREHEMTPSDLIGQLKGTEKYIFKKVFAGSMAQKLYRMYEYRK